MIEEILYGHGHSKRSSRCFIFLLEDRTVSNTTSGELAAFFIVIIYYGIVHIMVYV